MLYSYSRQNFGSTSPLFSKYTSARESVYPENNREMMPKLYLGWEQTMETNPTYASAGCPKNVDNSKQIWKYLYISNRISFEWETPNWVT